MAYVTSPLHSINASGGLAKTLIFQTYHHRTYVKQWNKPRNDRTANSVGIRAMVYWLCKVWKTLSPTDQASWALLAMEKNISPYNAFFKANMERWTNTQGPMTLLQTPPIGKYAPTLVMTATGGAGQVAISIAPATGLEHVNVTAGNPAPNPNCTGRYDYAGIYAGEPYYARTTEPTFLLYFDDGTYWWVIALETIQYPQSSYWGKADAINGEYNSYDPYTGKAICSAIMAGGTAAPNTAVAIFRDAATIAAPDRRLCRAVLSLDVNGQATWTDTNQVGAKKALPAGFPAGDYHYMALPLSLDGRVGTPTADVPATVT